MTELELRAEVFFDPRSMAKYLRAAVGREPGSVHDVPEVLEPGIDPPAVQEPDAKGNLARQDSRDVKPVLTGRQYIGQIDLACQPYKSYWDAGGNWIGDVGGVDTPAMWRMERFIQEYLIDYNASRAALAAGWDSDGQSLKRELSPIIRLRAATIAGRCGVTAERVLREYTKIAFSNITEYLGKDNSITTLSDLPEDKTAAIESIQVDVNKIKGDSEGGFVEKTRIKLSSKQSALEALGRHLGMFNADTTHKADVNKAPVIILYGDEKHISITRPKEVESRIIDDSQGVL